MFRICINCGAWATAPRSRRVASEFGLSALSKYFLIFLLLLLQFLQLIWLLVKASLCQETLIFQVLPSSSVFFLTNSLVKHLESSHLQWLSRFVTSFQLGISVDRGYPVCFLSWLTSTFAGFRVYQLLQLMFSIARTSSTPRSCTFSFNQCPLLTHS